MTVSAEYIRADYALMITPIIVKLQLYVISRTYFFTRRVNTGALFACHLFIIFLHRLSMICKHIKREVRCLNFLKCLSIFQYPNHHSNKVKTCTRRYSSKLTDSITFKGSENVKKVKETPHVGIARRMASYGEYGYVLGRSVKEMRREPWG